MKTYKFQQLAPTPARGKFSPALYTDPNYWGEEKFDGDRRIAQFVAHNKNWLKVRFTGRRLSDVDGLFVEKTDNVPHLSGWHPSDPKFKATLAPAKFEGTVLDGEIICPWPGARSKDVTSIMGSKPDLAISKQQERGWVKYVVFDCLFYQGVDVRKNPLTARRDCARGAIEAWGNPYVELADVVIHDREQFVLDVWKRGGEGIILKHRDSLYDEEKQWVKVKKEDTADVVITGFAAPEKMTEKTEQYVENGIKKKRVLEVSESRLSKKGWIGAVTFGQYRDGKLVECGQCSGMDDEVRAEFSLNPKRYVGTVIEILANEREPETGKFRHPRFVGFRPDKNPKDCKWEGDK